MKYLMRATPVDAVRHLNLEITKGKLNRKDVYIVRCTDLPMSLGSCVGNVGSGSSEAEVVAWIIKACNKGIIFAEGKDTFVKDNFGKVTKVEDGDWLIRRPKPFEKTVLHMTDERFHNTFVKDDGMGK